MANFIGKVGRELEIKETPKGKVLAFRFASTIGVGPAKTTTWYDVSVWDEKLIESCKKTLMVGSSVAIDGKPSTREYNGKSYEQIQAYRVGVIDWLERTLREDAPKAEPVQDEMPF